jgi:predicted small lipoprotein YifL
VSARRSGRNLTEPLAALTLRLDPALALRLVPLLAALALATVALAGCGQMGPLVLPGAAGEETAGQADPEAGANGEDETEQQNEGGAE